MNSVNHIKRPYYAVLFLQWLATALPLALLVLILQARGINLFQVGLLLGAYSLAIVFLELPTGGLADAIGRKRVTLLAYGATVISSIIILVAFSFPMFLLAFVLNGVGRALASGALDAWFVDALQTADPHIDIQPPLAQASTVSLIALGSGTLLGGLIPQWFAWLPSGETAVFTPLTMTIVIGLFIRLVSFTVLSVAIKEERGQTAASDWRQNARQVPAIIREAVQLSRRSRNVLLLLGITFVGGIGILSLETFWQPFFADLMGGGEENSFFFGLLMTGYFLVGIAGNMLATHLSKWLRKQYALVAALFQGLEGVWLLMLGSMTAVYPAAAFFWLAYMSLSGVNSPLAALFNQEIPADRRSVMLSIQSLAMYAGSIIGSSVLGYVAELFSIQVAWTVAGGVLLVSLYLYWPIYSQKRHERETKILPTG
jgi:predicted MFS family arabinose efflux permease